MSRLDDELKLALARQEPSADFASRVLERIASGGAAKKSWWERLLSVTRARRVRWVAIAAAAALLIAIAGSQYRTPQQQNVGQQQLEADKHVGSPPDVPDHVAPQPRGEIELGAETGGGAGNVGATSAGPKTNDQVRRAQHRRERELRGEGEAAKQQLMLALQVASTTLNGALREGMKGARIRGAALSRS